MTTTTNSAGLGSIVMWDLSNQTDPVKLKGALASEGITDVSMKGRTQRMSLKAALCEAFSGRGKMVRPVKENGAYTVVIEDRGEDFNKYGTEFTAHVCDDLEVWMSFRIEDTQSRVEIRDGGGYKTAEKTKRGWVEDNRWLDSNQRILASNLEDLLPKIRERIDWFFTMLPAAAVSMGLVEAVKRMGGIPLRDQGGVYHLPPAAMVRWESLVDAVKSAATGGTEHRFSRFDVEWNDQTANDLKRTVVDSLGSEVMEIMEEIRSSDFGDDALERRRVRIADIRKKASGYVDVLQDTLDGLMGLIGVAEQAAGYTAAVGESTVYDSILV